MNTPWSVPEVKSTPATKDYSPETVIKTAVTMCMNKSNGSIATAVDLLQTMAKQHPKLREAIADRYLREACWDAVQEWQGIVSTPKPPAISPPAPARAPDPATSKRRVMAMAKGLMDFSLPGGCLLRHATRVVVSQAVEDYEHGAKKFAHRARWLRLVAQSLPPGKRVSDVLTEDRLVELEKETADG